MSFLHFLSETGTNIFKITRQDICGFVEHEQDRDLKANSVTSNLRNVYTFINFLVEREILPQAIMSKKIRLKLPELLPRAIPQEHMATLLSGISNTRNRALILLLLRTGLRISELLNVKVSDIVMPERKILIYLAEKNDQGRVVYFDSDAESALRAWLEIRNKQKEYLFYSPTKDKIDLCSSKEGDGETSRKSQVYLTMDTVFTACAIPLLQTCSMPDYDWRFYSKSLVTNQLR